MRVISLRKKVIRGIEFDRLALEAGLIVRRGSRCIDIPKRCVLQPDTVTLRSMRMRLIQKPIRVLFLRSRPASAPTRSGIARVLLASKWPGPPKLSGIDRRLESSTRHPLHRSAIRYVELTHDTAAVTYVRATRRARKRCYEI